MFGSTSHAYARQRSPGREDVYVPALSIIVSAELCCVSFVVLRGGCFVSYQGPLEGCERRTKSLCKLKFKLKLTKHIGWLQKSSTPWEEIQAPFGFLFVIAP